MFRSEDANCSTVSMGTRREQGVRSYVNALIPFCSGPELQHTQPLSLYLRVTQLSIFASVGLKKKFSIDLMDK